MLAPHSIVLCIRGWGGGTSPPSPWRNRLWFSKAFEITVAPTHDHAVVRDRARNALNPDHSVNTGCSEHEIIEQQVLSDTFCCPPLYDTWSTVIMVLTLLVCRRSPYRPGRITNTQNARPRGRVRGQPLHITYVYEARYKDDTLRYSWRALYRSHA